MKLPDRYRDIIMSDLEPGEAYQKCVTEFFKESKDADYQLTETIVYATEVRYAIEIMTKGKPERFWNFGDLRGDAEERLAKVIDDVADKRIVFVGTGPYPVTAFLLEERYPDAAISCVDNNIAAYLLSQAVFEKIGSRIENHFSDAIDFDYSPFNIVIVAAMVSGKSELVKKILDASKALVVVRGTVDFDDPRLVKFDSTFTEDGILTGDQLE